MGPELCRQLASVLGTRTVTPAERTKVARAAEAAETWSDLPAQIRTLVEQLEQQPLVAP